MRHKRVCHYCGKVSHRDGLGPLRARRFDFMADFTQPRPSRIMAHKRCVRVHAFLPQILVLALIVGGGIIGLLEQGNLDGFVMGMAVGCLPSIIPIGYLYCRVEMDPKVLPAKT